MIIAKLDKMYWDTMLTEMLTTLEIGDVTTWFLNIYVSKFIFLIQDDEY